MFQGASSLSLDAKGRLSVPTRHRDVLSATAAGQLTITKHPHGCLMVFPRPYWEAFRDQVAQLPYSQVGVKRVFLGHADDVEWDATSRFLIRPELRSWAALEKDVTLLGMGSHFELWATPAYAAHEARVMQEQATAALDNLIF